jgi:predicted RNA-binding protein YlqC (UPF0109 family)
MNKDLEFVEFLVKSLVENVDAVKVDRKVDEMGVLISVDVAQEDMGKIIGRQGATAKAIRTLLRVVGMKNNARVNLKINEPNGGSVNIDSHTTMSEDKEFIGDQSGERFSSHLDDVDAVMNGIKNI